MCRKIGPRKRKRAESLFDIFRAPLAGIQLFIRQGERRKPRSRKERRENNSE